MALYSQDPDLERWRILNESLRELTYHAHWPAYLACLKDYEKHYIERLITSEAGDHNRICGIIEGLRLAIHIPERAAPGTP